MSQILSQDEVDALLQGVTTGDIDTDAAEVTPGQAKVYDLTSQERIIRGRMPAMEMANERLARYMRLSLSSVLRRMVEVSGVSVEMSKFVDFIRTIPLPSSINMFKMHPLKGTALLVFGAPLVFTLIELFFGGTGKGRTKTEGREFTPIEQSIINKIVKLVLGNIEDAWKMIIPVTTEYEGSEMNPQFVNIVAPTELVIKIELSIEIEAFSDRVLLCIPYSMVEPLKEKLHSTFQTDKIEQDNRWIPVIRELLLESSVNVNVELGRTTLKLRDLQNLKEGDVITLDRDRNEDLPMFVQGVHKLRVRPGQYHGFQAVRVSGFVPAKEV